MTRTLSITCTAYTALFAVSALLILVMSGEWHGLMPVVCTLAVLAMQILGYILARRRSLLAFSFSFIPALPLLAYFLTGGKVWVIVSMALLLAFVLVYTIRPGALPKPRFSTQKWISGLVLAEVMMVLVILLTAL